MDRLYGVRIAGALLFGLLMHPQPGHAFTSESPEVKSMVDKAVAYLEKLSDKEIQAGSWGGEQFHIVVVAYAHLKARHNHDAALVTRGVQQAKALAAAIRRNRGRMSRGKDSHDKTTYELAISILLLCEADAKAHLQDIETIRDALFQFQQPTGGFGYPNEQQGDTSQVQYVVLAMWTMDQKGIEVDMGRVNAVHAWMMRVQDPSGVWPYRATDPGPGKGLIAQGTHYRSHSTALAGASSVLIAGDFFRLWRESKGEENELGLPQAVKIFDESELVSTLTPQVDAARRRAAKVTKDEMMQAVERMNAWRAKNPYNRSGPGTIWHYYSLYSLERFESFFEFASQNPDSEPPWYNNAVKELMANQAPNGGWGVKDPSPSPPPVATSFALLFLTRSTKQAIGTISSGTVTGGYGLPSSTEGVQVKGAQIVGAPKAGGAMDMIKLLEEGGDEEIDERAIYDSLKLSDDPVKRADEVKRMKRLIKVKSYKLRRAAARVLGQSSDLDNVPILIYALSDPDKTVQREARNALRFVSRKFDGFGLSDNPTPKELDDAIEAWKQWYLSANPSYEFLDD